MTRAGAEEHCGLWPSAKVNPMGGGATYDAVRRRTMFGLGLPINLHRFRSIAGQSSFFVEPMNVSGVKDLQFQPERTQACGRWSFLRLQQAARAPWPH